MLPYAVFVATLAVFSCGKQQAEPPRQPPALTQGSAPNAVAGIQWEVPKRWVTQPARQMRIATYTLPSPKEGIEDGECGVFYFGSGQGGDVESNIKRWVSQFENAGDLERSARKVHELEVTLVDLSGTYNASTGPMMGGGQKKPGYRLLGAIVEAPDGLVFFKAVGPQETVKAEEGNFNLLVESIGVR